uniref:Uncharacterized protein n=1 Tax=Panagrolaimus superbus TaxID=310955 RepID=A0A914Y5A8_9BILA
MVLNWAFDTLYTHKTPSYYIQCFCIFTSIIIFGSFNLWQLMVSQDFCNYVEMLARTEIATTKSQQTGVTSLDIIHNEKQLNPVVLVVNRNSTDMIHNNSSSTPSGQDYRLVL